MFKIIVANFFVNSFKKCGTVGGGTMRGPARRPRDVSMKTNHFYSTITLSSVNASKLIFMFKIRDETNLISHLNY